MTTLTATQIANTTADHVSVQVRTFAGDYYAKYLRPNGIASLLATWTDPDTGKPAGLTEITARVSWRSTCTYEWRGNTLAWTAELQGTDYDAAYLDLGRTIVQWMRIWRPASGWQPWLLDLVGQITNRDDVDNCQHGQQWTRTLVGTNGSLDRWNAPHLVAGPIDVATGSTVTASPALALPELERDTGEFIGEGATDSVQADNIADGKLGTVYISEAIPAATIPTWPVAGEDGNLWISEVFCKPVVGWPASQCWWVEIWNGRRHGGQEGSRIYLKLINNPSHVQAIDSSAGIFMAPGTQILHPDRFAVVCGNRTFFEKYTGGAPNAEFVLDASAYKPTFIPDVTDGYIAVCGPDGTGLSNGIAWAPAGALRRYEGWDTGSPNWAARAAVNETALPVGDSIAWYGDTANRDAYYGFYQNNAPHPGDYRLPQGGVWAQVVLPANACKLIAPLSASSTHVALDNYLGWRQPTTAEGGTLKGIVSLGTNYVFNYSGRDTGGLIVASWDNAPPSPLPIGTAVNPLAYVTLNGAGSWYTMDGYPLIETQLVRRKTPVVEGYQCLWSPFEARTPGTDGWRGDYYDHWHFAGGLTGQVITDALSDGAYGFLWVRTILYFVEHMADSGRAKINEVRAKVAQTALGWSGTPDVNGERSVDLAWYLLRDYYGMAARDTSDASSHLAHQLGQHATAIQPISQVLDDLARATGCLVDYTPVGTVYWRDDPRWPLGRSETAPLYTFDAASLRGDLHLTQGLPPVNYVILNATSLEGGEPHAVRVVYPPGPKPTGEPEPGALTEEISGYNVAQDQQAFFVAESEWHNRFYTGTATLTVKGVGEWCRPGLWVGTTWDHDGSGLTTQWWLIDKVTRRRELADGQPAQTTELSLRQYLS
jgi:hypothetical protein